MPQFHSDAAETATEEMNDFFKGYIMAMYWTETGDGEQPDSEIELSSEARDRAYNDCLAFQSVYAWPLAAAYDRVGYDEARAGHDFWLTRNGHGTGFWDRDELGEERDLLSDGARGMGACDAYEGDDGLLYLGG